MFDSAHTIISSFWTMVYRTLGFFFFHLCYSTLTWCKILSCKESQANRTRSNAWHERLSRWSRWANQKLAFGKDSGICCPTLTIFLCDEDAFHVWIQVKLKLEAIWSPRWRITEFVAMHELYLDAYPAPLLVVASLDVWDMIEITKKLSSPLRCLGAIQIGRNVDLPISQQLRRLCLDDEHKFTYRLMWSDVPCLYGRCLIHWRAIYSGRYVSLLSVDGVSKKTQPSERFVDMYDWRIVDIH